MTRIDRSPGLNGLHPRVLKECAVVLTRPLATLFRKTRQEGKIQDDWSQQVSHPFTRREIGQMPPTTTRLA